VTVQDSFEDLFTERHSEVHGSFVESFIQYVLGKVDINMLYKLVPAKPPI